MPRASFTIIDNFLEPQTYEEVDESAAQQICDAVGVRFAGEMPRGSFKPAAQHQAGKSSILVRNELTVGFDVEFGIFETGLDGSEFSLRRGESTTLIFCFSDLEFRKIMDEAITRTQLAPQSTGKVLWGGSKSRIVYRSQVLNHHLRTLEFTDEASKFSALEDFYSFAKSECQHIVTFRKPKVRFAPYLVSTTDELLFAFKILANHELDPEQSGLSIVDEFKGVPWSRSEMNLVGDEVDVEYRKSSLKAARTVNRNQWDGFFGHLVDYPKAGFFSFLRQ